MHPMVGNPRIFGVWFVLGLMLPAVAFAQWQPLPAPDKQEMLTWESLDPEIKSTKLKPGQSWEFEPGRLQVVRVQFRPVDADPLLTVSQIDTLEDGGELSAVLEPIRTDLGDWIFLTSMQRSSPMRVTLSKNSKFEVEVGAFGMETIEPWMYWELWQTHLHRWWDKGEGDPPEGIPVPGQTQVLAEAERARLVMALVDRLGGSADEKKAARHLGHAYLLRGIQQVRRPRTRFYTRRDAISDLDEKPRSYKVDTGDRVDDAVQLDPGLDETLVVDGPAVVRLGLRAIKELDRPDIVSRFDLKVTNSNGTLVHKDQFSSRAARLDQEELNADEADNPQTEEVEEPEDVQYVSDSRGRIVGWRRTTQWWVPPGRHRLKLEIAGSQVLFDGEIYRPKTHVEDAATKIENSRHHVEQAERLLDPKSVVSTLLRLEITGFLQNNQRVGTLADSLEKSDKLARAPELAKDWLLSARLRWSADLVEVNEALQERIVACEEPRLKRELAFAGADLALRAGRPEIALFLMNATPQTATEGENAALIRAEAMMAGGRDHPSRWAGLAMLYRAWKNRPYDVRLRKALQKAWWYRTYWLPMTRASRRTAEIRLEPLGEPNERIYVAEIADRTTLLYRPKPNQPFSFRLRQAPDIPERLVRARIFASGDGDKQIHPIELNGDDYGLARTEASETFDFAVQPGEQKLVVKDDSQVLIAHPPERQLDISLADVFERRRYWKVDTAGASWDIGDSKDPRFVRVRIHPTQPNQSGKLILDDGVQERRQLEFTGLNPETPPLVSVFEIPAGISSVRLRLPSGEPVLASLDVRVAKAPPPVPPIEEPVVLPPDKERLDRIRKLSRAIASGPVIKRPEERLERARILMSLDQDKLARVDLEAVLADEHSKIEMIEEARGRYEAVRERLRSRYLELTGEWLQGQSMPMTLNGAVGTAETKSCVDPPEPEKLDDKTKNKCAVFWRYLEFRADPDGESALESLRYLAENMPAHRYLGQNAYADYIRRQIRALEGDKEKLAQLPPGLAAEAYGNARLAMLQFPMASIRSEYYGGLRWTGWESVPTIASGRFLVELDPHLDPVNQDDFIVPTTSSSDETAVDYAMTGTDWSPEGAPKVFGAGSRTIRFKTLQPALLEVETTCVDLRPDLQPDLPRPPGCRLIPDLEEDGKRVQAESVGGTFVPGQVYVTRFPVVPGKAYRLRVEREDDLAGRTSIMRARLLPSGSPAEPVVPLLRRRLDMVSAALPASLDVAGPVFLRVDARSVQPDTSTKIDITMTGPDGQVATRTIELNPAVQAGATLNELSLHRAVRDEFWIPFRGATQLEFKPDKGFATLRVSMRVDDYERLLRPSSRGWIDVEGLTRPEPAPDWEEPDAPEVATLVRPDYLLVKFRVTASGRVDLRWETRDLTLIEDLVPSDARQAPYMTLLGGGYTRVPAINAWVDGRLGLRTTFRNPPVYQLYAGGYWHEEFTNIRVEPDVRFYAQDAGGFLASSRAFLRISRPWAFLPDFLALPALRFVGRFQPSNALEVSDGEADPIIFSSYAEDHVITTELVATVWWQPFLNMRAIGKVTPVFNPNYSIDQIRLDAATQAMIQSTRIDFGYGFRWLFADDARELGQPVHEFDLSGRLGYWVHRQHLLSFDLWTRLGIVPGSEEVTRFRVGLGVTYWFSETGLDDVRPSNNVYGDLLEPRYFR